jgi:hypothetical protein
MGLKILNLEIGRKEGGFRMEMKSNLKVGFILARQERAFWLWELCWNCFSLPVIKKL